MIILPQFIQTNGWQKNVWKLPFFCPFLLKFSWKQYNIEEIHPRLSTALNTINSQVKNTSRLDEKKNLCTFSDMQNLGIWALFWKNYLASSIWWSISSIELLVATLNEPRKPVLFLLIFSHWKTKKYIILWGNLLKWTWMILFINRKSLILTYQLCWAAFELMVVQCIMISLLISMSM